MIICCVVKKKCNLKRKYKPLYTQEGIWERFINMGVYVHLSHILRKSVKDDGHIKQMFVIRKKKEDCIILILNAFGDIKTFLE